MFRTFSRRLGLSLVALVLAACAAGPNFKPSPINTAVPERWRDSTISTQDSSYANLAWWEVLGDSTLQQLVRIALRENRDLRIALANVNEARARLGIQRLEFLPQIDVSGRAAKVHVSDSFFGLRTGTYNLLYVGGGVVVVQDFRGRL